METEWKIKKGKMLGITVGPGGGGFKQPGRPVHFGRENNHTK